MKTALPPALSRGQVSKGSIEAWNAAVDDVHTKLQFRNDSGRRFSGSLSTAALGELTACSFRGTALTASRMNHDIARSAEGTTIMIWQFRGRSRGRQGGKEADLLPGSIVFLDLDTPYEVNCSDDFGELVIHIPTEALEQRLFAHGVRKDFRGSSLAECPQAVPWMCFLGSAFAQAQEAEPSEVDPLYGPALEALASLAALSIRRENFETNAELICRSAVQTVSAEYWRADFTADDLARSLHVSRRTLFRSLDEGGTSFSLLLHEARLSAAAALLGRSALNLTIEAIGHTVGYQSASTFYTRFREKFGASPGDYRQRILVNGTHPQTA